MSPMVVPQGGGGSCERCIPVLQHGPEGGCRGLREDAGKVTSAAESQQLGGSNIRGWGSLGGGPAARWVQEYLDHHKTPTPLGPP